MHDAWQAPTTMAFKQCTTVDELLLYTMNGLEDRETFETHLYALLWKKYKDTGVFTALDETEKDIRSLCSPAMAFMSPTSFTRRIKQDHQPHTNNLYADIAHLTEMVDAVRLKKNTVKQVPDDNTVRAMAMSAALGFWSQTL